MGAQRLSWQRLESDSVFCAQPYPDLEKQPKWEVDVRPDAVDWDAEIAAVVERGKDVPEVDWVKPGEDAAMEVTR